MMNIVEKLRIVSEMDDLYRPCDECGDNIDNCCCGYLYDNLEKHKATFLEKWRYCKEKEWRVYEFYLSKRWRNNGSI